MPKKIALILNPIEGTPTFYKGQDAYYSRISLLERNGYEVREVEVKSEEDIKAALENCGDNELDFLQLRGHGAQKQIEFNKDNYYLNANKVSDTFKKLPSKLTDNAKIVLFSCATADLIGKEQNMQTAFADLTIDKANVIIAAPKEPAHINNFEITNNQFSFFACNAIHYYNMVSIIGPNTKESMRNSSDSDKYCSEEFKAGLKKDQHKLLEPFAPAYATSKYAECNLFVKDVAIKAFIAKDIEDIKKLAPYLGKEEIFNEEDIKEIDNERKELGTNQYTNNSKSLAYIMLQKTYDTPDAKTFNFQSEVFNVLSDACRKLGGEKLVKDLNNFKEQFIIEAADSLYRTDKRRKWMQELNLIKKQYNNSANTVNNNSNDTSKPKQPNPRKENGPSK